MGSDRHADRLNRCENCGGEHDRPFVTCPDCGDWLDEARFYA